MESDILISCLAFIFLCKSQMFSAYSKNKGTGLAVPVAFGGGGLYMISGWREYPRMLKLTCAECRSVVRKHLLIC